MHLSRVRRGQPLDTPPRRGPGRPPRLCDVPGCCKRHRAKGFCRLHYHRHQRGIELNKPLPIQGEAGKRCQASDCKRPTSERGVFCSAHHYRRDNGLPMDAPLDPHRECGVPGCPYQHRARGFCSIHYRRALREGEVQPLPEKQYTFPAIEPSPDGTCGTQGCQRGLRGRGYCDLHFRRAMKGATPEELQEPPRQRAPNGSGYVTKAGYRRLSKPGHPNVRADGSIEAHRWLMAESLGRPLWPGETVHHKNGDRLDNRIVKGHEIFCPNTCCNLELWVRGQPAGQRVLDKIRWAWAFLQTYRSDLAAELNLEVLTRPLIRSGMQIPGGRSDVGMAQTILD